MLDTSCPDWGDLNWSWIFDGRYSVLCKPLIQNFNETESLKSWEPLQITNLFGIWMVKNSPIIEWIFFLFGEPCCWRVRLLFNKQNFELSNLFNFNGGEQVWCKASSFPLVFWPVARRCLVREEVGDLKKQNKLWKKLICCCWLSVIAIKRFSCPSAKPSTHWLGFCS